MHLLCCGRESLITMHIGVLCLTICDCVCVCVCVFLQAAIFQRGTDLDTAGLFKPFFWKGLYVGGLTLRQPDCSSHFFF